MRARHPRLAHIAALCLTLALVAAACGDPAPVTVVDVDPLFTDPIVKLAETADPAFAQKLYDEARRLEPLISTAGTQVHMGLWSSSGNHGALVKLREHWYERASPYDGTIYIYRVAYQDPYPVTTTQADQIWGQYSARYVDMAELIFRATGRTVKVWAYTFNGRACRIFYKYEFPELQRLEPTGAVEVYVARSLAADWNNSADWYVGTVNAPPGVPCQ